MLGGFAFDLFSLFKDCWPAACEALGDLAVSKGIREYPTVLNKPSNHMASKQERGKSQQRNEAGRRIEDKSSWWIFS